MRLSFLDYFPLKINSTIFINMTWNFFEDNVYVCLLGKFIVFFEPVIIVGYWAIGIRVSGLCCIFI